MASLSKIIDVYSHAILNIGPQVPLANQARSPTRERYRRYTCDGEDCSAAPALYTKDLEKLADVVHPSNDVGAPISSGSFKTLGMLIAPCSMRSLAEIASGVTASLLTRAADVVLKERRRLVLMVREAPLTLIHLRNMATVTEAGGVIFPPVPAFYMRPTTIDELVDHSVGRALDQFGLHVDTFPRWNEEFRRKQLKGAPADNSEE